MLLAKDYERKVQTSETLIELAAIRLLLRRLAGHVPPEAIYDFTHQCQVSAPLAASRLSSSRTVHKGSAERAQPQCTYSGLHKN
jgi:hypothetical protein